MERFLGTGFATALAIAAGLGLSESGEDEVILIWERESTSRDRLADLASDEDSTRR